MKKPKNGKAPGPDKMTTDGIKEMNDIHPEKLLDAVNGYWTKGAVPDNICFARVVSFF